MHAFEVCIPSNGMTRALFSQLKQPQHEDDDSFPSDDEVKNALSFVTAPYVHNVQLRQRDNFSTFTSLQLKTDVTQTSA
jgi:hypothetical protein